MEGNMVIHSRGIFKRARCRKFADTSLWKNIDTMVGERLLGNIRKKWVVDAEDLMKEPTEEECYEGEDGEAENELLSWSRESKKK